MSWAQEKFGDEWSMSTEKPNMKYWQKLSSQGKKEGQPMSTKKLKDLLDASILVWLLKTGKSKIPLSKFKDTILTQIDPTVLAKFNIILYKNGVTVKVTNKLLTSGKAFVPIEPPSPFVPVWTTSGFEASTSINPKSKVLKPSKGMKKIILAAKSEAVVTFHKIRKHTAKFNMCLACKATKAFIEWEFHYQPEKNAKTITVPKIGQLTAVELTTKKTEMSDEMSFIKTPLAVVEAPDKGTPQLGIIKTKPGESNITHVTVKPIKSKNIKESDMDDFFTDKDKLKMESCNTTYNGEPVQICSCGNIQIVWDMPMKNIGGQTPSGAVVPNADSLMDQLNDTIKKHTINPYLGVWSADNILADESLWEEEEDNGLDG